MPRNERLAAAAISRPAIPDFILDWAIPGKSNGSKSGGHPGSWSHTPGFLLTEAIGCARGPPGRGPCGGGSGTSSDLQQNDVDKRPFADRKTLRTVERVLESSMTR